MEPGRPNSTAGDGARGSVTAETAVCLPGVVVVLAALVWAVSVAAAQVSCVDAARTAARAVARGESVPAARAAARQALPGAGVEIRVAGGQARVRVTARVAGPGRFDGLAVPLRADAVAELEATGLGPAWSEALP